METPLQENQTCEYRFEHPNRPRDVCGLPAEPACPCKDFDPAAEHHCSWHCLKLAKSPDAYPPSERGFIRNQLEEAVKNGHYLEGAVLICSDLAGARLKGAHLERAVLLDACLKGATLKDAHLEDALLNQATFENAILWGANLQGASMVWTRFNGARLRFAQFSASTFSRRTVWGICGEEAQGDFRGAIDVYRAIRAHYDETGGYKESAEFYFREMRLLHRETVEDPAWPRQAVHPVQLDISESSSIEFERSLIYLDFAKTFLMDLLRPVVIDWTDDWIKAWRNVLRQAATQWWDFLRGRYKKLTEPPAEGRIPKPSQQRFERLRTWLRKSHFAKLLGESLRKLGESPVGARIRRASRAIKAVVSIIAFPFWHPLWRWYKRPLTRFIWALHRFVWGYGVRPARTFGWMAVVIFLSTLGFFWWLPVTCPDRSDVLPCENPGGLAGLRLALTVSLDAFSSVGYGGYRPATDWGQLLAGIEGMAGILLAAAFLVALATKYVRRG
ncbi:MAG: hypothetical protein GTO55_07510 [Armatimonadetes bacterium]|nr:hypothetical protein [Armatimonadota bacterium]NIM24115.1 hypothetical protein [Armatimonadota bacterium]NIM67970.1 hypothetical protein [Armatimonadota bacterium]NIN06199.1 hypothetical protein [Armatimonadota bacterium]NIO97642.1 hypothetical protein [Armatimonadota bacterium]